MSNAKTITLDEAVKAAQKLPIDTQAALANELMEHVRIYRRPIAPANART